jgi:hypothetical protein
MQINCRFISATLTRKLCGKRSERNKEKERKGRKKQQKIGIEELLMRDKIGTN